MLKGDKKKRMISKKKFYIKEYKLYMHVFLSIKQSRNF